MNAVPSFMWRVCDDVNNFDAFHIWMYWWISLWNSREKYDDQLNMTVLQTPLFALGTISETHKLWMKMTIFWFWCVLLFWETNAYILITKAKRKELMQNIKTSYCRGEKSDMTQPCDFV